MMSLIGINTVKLGCKSIATSSTQREKQVWTSYTLSPPSIPPPPLSKTKQQTKSSFQQKNQTSFHYTNKYTHFIRYLLICSSPYAPRHLNYFNYYYQFKYFHFHLLLLSNWYIHQPLSVWMNDWLFKIKKWNENRIVNCKHKASECWMKENVPNKWWNAKKQIKNDDIFLGKSSEIKMKPLWSNKRSLI